ncbi:ras-like protein family member 11A-like isoform X2 [Esox lucius]|uniref:ras-like protein family member 11A-like isoform X2 n=1 Tax=Esox lucius TaxID=8010 RepID=UPI00097345A5|nr:ras-like protein family member 11A-like isoform X2 [Esox lucius]
MRLLVDPPRTMNSGSSNFLLVPIPEYPVLDCVPNKNVKIVVLGASNVGKTALIVRFLTKRFIGDYEANTGALYSRKISIDGEQVSLQVQDTPCVSLQDDAEGLYCQEQINRSIYWADGYVLVFSITDHNSYRTIQPLYQHVRRIHPAGNIPVILLAVARFAEVCKGCLKNSDPCSASFFTHRLLSLWATRVISFVPDRCHTMRVRRWQPL